MLCKVAQSDVKTDDLIWQPVGAATVSGPKPKPSAPPNPTTGGRPFAQNESQIPSQAIVETHGQVAALQRRISELEAQNGSQQEQARRKGFEDGVSQGKKDASHEMEAALERLGRTTQDIAQMRQRLRHEAETELVQLSLAIARRILHRELTTDPQSLKGVVYAALDKLKNREVNRVRIFPAGVNVLRTSLEKNFGSQAIEIVADPMLLPGGVVFETALGELDASVDTQLQEIERGFVDRLQLR